MKIYLSTCDDWSHIDVDYLMLETFIVWHRHVHGRFYIVIYYGFFFGSSHFASTSYMSSFCAGYLRQTSNMYHVGTALEHTLPPELFHHCHRVCHRIGDCPCLVWWRLITSLHYLFYEDIPYSLLTAKRLSTSDSSTPTQDALYNSVAASSTSNAIISASLGKSWILFVAV